MPSHDNASNFKKRGTVVWGIHIGHSIWIDGNQFKLLHRLENGTCTFQRLDDLSTVNMTKSEVMKGYREKRIRFAGDGPNERAGLLGVEHIKPELLDIGRWRLYFVSAYNKIDKSERSPKRLKVAYAEARIAASNDESLPPELRLKQTPGNSTVYSWMPFWNPDLGALSLVPNFERCGGRGSRLNPIFEAIIEDQIEEWIGINNSQRQELVEAIEIKFNEVTKSDPRLIGERVPSQATIYRRIRALGGETLDAIEYGRKTAHRKYKPAGASPKYEIPYQRIEIDTTKIDIRHKENGIILKRAFLTAAIDAATRMLVGYIFTHTQPSAADICRLIRMIVLPKDAAWLAAMGVTEPWETFGTPKEIVTDNGKEYKSAAVAFAVQLLNIGHRLCPPGSPEYKARIERWFGTASRRALHPLPGTTRSNSKSRGERNPLEDNLLTLKEIEQVFIFWVCNKYHLKKHRALGCSPLSAWNRALRKHEIRPPCSAELAERITHATESRVVRHDGIALFGLRYNSQKLADIRRANHGPARVDIQYDPLDMSKIIVRDPNSTGTIVVPSVEPIGSDLDLKSIQMIRDHSVDEDGKLHRAKYLANAATYEKMIRGWAGPRPTHMTPKGYKRKPKAKLADIADPQHPSQPRKPKSARPKTGARSSAAQAASSSQDHLEDPSLVPDLLPSGVEE